MPHLTIEYSNNVANHHDIQGLVKVVHEAAIGHGLAAVEGLRTRAIGYDHYLVATGNADFAFIAIRGRIGPGRTVSEKEGFIKDVLDAAEAFIEASASPLAISWSIELNEIEAAFRINRNRVRERMAETESS